MCLAARPSADPERTKDLLAADLDWNEITARAADHGLRPALIALLSAVDWRGVPPVARQRLESFQHHHLLHTLAMADELAQMARDFEAQGIRFVLFKGAALAVQLYRQLAAREFNDIDLIVPPDQVADAEAVLARRGYRPLIADRGFFRYFLGHQGQCAFYPSDGRPGFDLHWAFADTFLPFPLSPDFVWGDFTSVTIAGVEVPVLRPENVALLLAGHGTKEGWRSLMWLRDFAVLIERWADLDWRGIHNHARMNGCGDAVLLACAVTERVLGVSPPAALVPALAANGRVALLAERHAERVLAGDVHRRHLDDLSLCDRRPERLRAGLAFALAPTPGDYRMIPLPRALWPAYYALRPLRLACKAMRAALPS